MKDSTAVSNQCCMPVNLLGGAILLSGRRKSAIYISAIWATEKRHLNFCYLGDGKAPCMIYGVTTFSIKDQNKSCDMLQSTYSSRSEPYIIYVYSSMPRACLLFIPTQLQGTHGLAHNQNEFIIWKIYFFAFKMLHLTI